MRRHLLIPAVLVAVTSLTACPGRYGATGESVSPTTAGSVDVPSPSPDSSPPEITTSPEPPCCAPETTATTPQPSTTAPPVDPSITELSVPEVECVEYKEAWDVPFEPCQSSSAIQLMQAELNYVGSYGLDVDRWYGPATTAAVFDFQLTHGLPATGICDWATWSLLFPAEDSPWIPDLNGDGVIGPMEMTGE